MKKMLVGVDFSDASANALAFAFRLNRYFIARMQVLHLFDIPIAVGDDSELYLRNYESYRKSFDDELWDFIRRNKGEYHYETEVFSTSGGHYQGIVDFTRRHQPDLVIIGHKGTGGIRRILFGSVARYLLTHPPIPVLSIPLEFQPTDIKKILLTTDMSNLIPEKCCGFLKNFGDRIGAEIEIVHVKEKWEISLPVEEKIRDQIKSVFGKEVTILPAANGESLSQVINNYVQTSHVDLLVTVPHFHTWIDRVLIGSETSSLVSVLKIPVMSLPGK
jgi:nucleotide-binding universal stress UspA family protein